MRFKTRCLLLSVLLLFTWGCSQKSAKLQKSVAPPDKTLFETGSGYLRKSQYIRARLAFQTLINTYPDSELAAESYFSIGDSFYEEGGTENLLQAEDQYNNFIVFFPGHPKGPDAQMKIIAANIKMMRSPDRDQQYSYKAEGAIKKMLEQYPDSDYAPIAKRYLSEVQDVIARGDLGVGIFYEERGNLAGAQLRYQEIMDKYPEFAGLDQLYFRLGKLWEAAKQPDQAATFYSKVLAGYPFSKYYEEAKMRMNSLGKPLPPVDTQLAALNESRLRPDEGFSPLKPFIEFGKALGFVGPPDRYEEAVATLAAERTKAEEEAEAAKQAAAKVGTDGIQIETILRKSADGEVQDETVIGSGAGEATDEEKKKDTSKTKKRNPKRPS